MILSAPLEYIVTAPVELSAPLVYHVLQPFNLSAQLEYTVHTFYSVPSEIVWSLSLSIGGVDYSSRLTGRVRITRETRAAALADFVMIPNTGPINPESFDGQSVEIHYADQRGSALLFLGVVIKSAINLTSGDLSLTASDLMQERFAKMSTEQIDALIPHHRSSAIYTLPDDNFDYVEQCINSADGDYCLAIDGTPVYQPWDSPASLTHSDVNLFDATLQPSFADRGRLVNRIELEIQHRHLIGWHRQHSFEWAMGWGYSQWVVEQFSTLPQKAMIEQALPRDMAQVSLSYVEPPPSGLYYYKSAGPVAFNNQTQGLQAFAFTAEYAQRWVQTFTRRVSVVVSASDSIDAYGEIPARRSYSIDDREDGIDFAVLGDSGEYGASLGFDENGDPVAGSGLTPPAGAVPFSTAGIVTHRLPLFGSQNHQGLAAAGLECVIYEAHCSILASHQTVEIGYAVPVNPLLSLSDTVSLTATKCTANGRLKSISHEFDFDTGEVLSALKIVPAPGDQLTVLTIPAVDALPVPAVAAERSSMQTYLGPIGGSEPEGSDAWRGYVGNYANSTAYNERFTCEVPEVETALREAVETEDALSYEVSVNLSKLVMSL